MSHCKRKKEQKMVNKCYFRYRHSSNFLKCRALVLLDVSAIQANLRILTYFSLGKYRRAFTGKYRDTSET
jgi:hypothetical protein